MGGSGFGGRVVCWSNDRTTHACQVLWERVVRNPMCLGLAQYRFIYRGKGGNAGIGERRQYDRQTEIWYNVYPKYMSTARKQEYAI